MQEQKTVVNRNGMDYFFRASSTDFFLVIIFLLSKIALQINPQTTGLDSNFISGLGVFCIIGIVIFPIFYVIQLFYDKNPTDQNLNNLYSGGMVIISTWAIAFLLFFLLFFIPSKIS